MPGPSKVLEDSPNHELDEGDVTGEEGKDLEEEQPEQDSITASEGMFSQVNATHDLNDFYGVCI